jgi:adenosylmethionine-8-amino-7-oxononanoate aminotransferase
MRDEKEMMGSVKPGNRPAELKAEGDWSHVFSYHPMDVEIKKSEGIYYYDVDGKRYIDGSGGPMAFTLPHGDARMKKAITDQMDNFTHMHPTLASRPVADLCAKIAEVTPPKLNTTYLVSGGSEAVETAMKAARQHHMANGNDGKYKIISNYQSYHGMTLATQGLSGNPAYEKYFGSMLTKWPHIHQYSDHDKPAGMTREDWGIKCAQRLEKMIYFEGAATVSAYIVTPHGCGNEYGVVAPKEYWQEIRRICDRYNVLLIADEVVTGFGRTGEWFGLQHFGVEADIMTTAKGISGCYIPLGAVMVSDEINAPFEAGKAHFVHGFTNGGHPVACAAGIQCINILQEDKLIENSRETGKHLFSYKDKLLSHPSVADARGWGMFMCLELVESKESGEYFEAERGAEAAFQSISLKNGLAFFGTLYGARREPLFKRGAPLMISPPLSITPDQVDDLVGRLDDTLYEWEAEMGVS